MTHCEHCRDRLLDYVYGLLEGSELQQTGEHLNSCSECQAALKKALTQQKLMARAARAITEVAEFTLPSSAPAAAATLPIVSAPKVNRSMWRRPWVGWTAAAAVLLAVSASFSYYRTTLHGYQDRLTEKRKEHKAVVEQFASLAVKYEAKQQAAIRDLRVQAGPYLNMVGPTTLQPGAKGHLHITTRHVEGDPAIGSLRIKVVEADTGNLVQFKRLDCDKEVLHELEVGNTKPNTTLNVIVEAETAFGRTSIQDKVRIEAPTYVTRIDTNKSAYQFKDVLFFRVLVLDRYSLQPPTQPIGLRVELVDPKSRAVRSLDMLTGDGGVLAREFAVDDKFLEGIYRLNVRPLDPAKTPLQPASQRLEIVRELRVPAIQFDRDDYLPGDKVTGVVRGAPLSNIATLNDVKVPVTVQPQPATAFGAPVARGEAGGGIEPNNSPTDAKAIQRFQMTMPPLLPQGANRGAALAFQLGAGKEKRELRANVPLAPTDFTIDFFPEGGDLIAGVQNRVFYRVRSKSGEPITGEGSVILLSSKNDVVDSSYQLGLGYFDFTPHPKKTYTVRITTPVKVETVADPFANHKFRGEGVVVHVPRAVGSQGDPIRITLRQQGPARKLLLLAQCRGQIVDQRWVEVKRGSIDLTLQPTPEAFGMIRVTAYELQENTLRDDLSFALLGFAHAPTAKLMSHTLMPVAERLVYRTATQRLDLAFNLNTLQINAGRQVTGKLSARDEKGQPAAAWLLASVIDERFQARPRSLSAHFCLLNEIHTGADLDNAQLILHDSPESVQVMERFLGTHGWRRFVRSQAPSIGVFTGAAHSAQPMIFSRENMPLDEMQKKYEGKLAAVLPALRVSGFTERDDLEHQRDRAAEAVILAASDLYNFEEQMQLWLRFPLVLALVLLLVASMVLMVFGLFRILRAQKTATPAFGSAFACLVGCLGILFLGNWLGPISVTAPTSPLAAHGPTGWQVQKDLGDIFTRIPAVRNVPEQPLIGAFALRSSNNAESAGPIALVKKDEGNNPAPVLRDFLARPRRELGESFNVLADRKREDQQFGNASPAMARRWKQALDSDTQATRAADILKPAVQPEVKPKRGPVTPTGPDKDVQKKKIERAAGSNAVEYAHKYVPNLQSDTLLWHPTLWLANGAAEVHFDIGSGNATYRVLLLGHSPAGRFGFFETRLDVLGR
jgi:hypothetical protein